MNPDILIVFATLLTASVLFVSNWIRNDLVAMLVMLTLMLSGILTVDESLAGFSDPVVIMPLSVGVLIAGILPIVTALNKSGAASPLSSAANMLIQESGSYNFVDFIKIGMPLQLLTLMVTVATVWCMYLL